jgi:hypothetical protein
MVIVKIISNLKVDKPLSECSQFPDGTDQADISDNDCANLDCKEASGKMVGCQSKISLVHPLAGNCPDLTST